MGWAPGMYILKYPRKLQWWGALTLSTSLELYQKLKSNIWGKWLNFIVLIYSALPPIISFNFHNGREEKQVLVFPFQCKNPRFKDSNLGLSLAKYSGIYSFPYKYLSICFRAGMVLGSWEKLANKTDKNLSLYRERQI